MWKYLVLLVLVQRRTILSQPVIDENVREARQLNFGDCCPCPGSERSAIRDKDVWDSQMQVLTSSDDCPCRTASDSDAASSVFRPAMRTVEPFIRPGETNGEPKPLLKPEVGLASSVLETLQEVTDQEYQEALAREAARSAIDASQVNSFEQETETERNNAPKNIVNIILKPKQITDAMPEASHVQETRCVHSPLGQSSYDDSVVHSVPLFRNSIPKGKNNGLLHKNLFDMDNSASNIKENVLMPLKSNILDDLKLKSDLIKLKLFPEMDNNLKGDIKTDSDNARISNMRLSSLIDHFKKPKDKDYLPLPSIDNIDKEKESDTTSMYSLSNSEKYVLSNKAKSYDNTHTFLHSKKPFKGLDLLSNSVKSKPTLSFNSDEENLEGVIDNTVLSEINDCKFNLSEGDDQNSNIINSIDTRTSDIASSPSEIIENKSSMSTEVPENRMNDEFDAVDNENEVIDQHEIDDDKQQLTTNIEETIPTNFNECLSDENTDMDQSNNFIAEDITYKGEESLCNVEDPDVEASINNPQIISLQEEDSKYVNSNDDNEPRNVNTQNLDDQHSNDVSTIITTTEKILVDSTPKSSTLPNIKDNILKTIENFKKTNERIQEKIKSNVQDALKLLVVKNNPVVEIDSSPSNGPSEEENNKVKNNINLKDLQEMSNRILNLSSLKEEEEVKASSQSKENVTKDTKYNNGERAGDNNQETSKLNTISLSTESPSEIFKSTTSPKTSLENSNELMERSNIEELKETPRNPILSSCDDMSLKSSDPVETEADLLDDQNNEMFSQASSPIVSSIQHVLQPNTNSDVKAFFENFQTSVSDVFNSNRVPKIFSLINDNANDDSITNTIFTKNQQLSSDEPLARLKSDKSRKVKNPSSNINLYKTKVAVPESLNIKALPKSISRESDVLSKFLKESPEMTAASNTLREHMDILSPNNLKSKIGNSNHRRDNSELKILKFNGLQNIMPNSDHFHALTENTLRNIQGAFDETLKNPFTRNHVKMLSKERPVDLFETMAKTNDEFTEKFRAFHSGLNDRLSSFSQKISNISPLQVRNDHTFRATKNNNNVEQLKSPTAKSRTSLLDADKTALKVNNLNRALSSKEIISNSKPKLLQKFNIPSKHVALDSKKIPTITRPTKLDEIKSSLRKDIKLKPLKESKVTISFSTTARPKLISKIKTSSMPSSVKSKTSLLTKNSSLKRPEIKSKLKTGESKALASEQIASRVPFSDRSFINARKLSPLYEKTSDLEDTNTRSNSDFEESILSERKTGNSVLSKIREAVKARTTEDSANKIIKNNMLSSSGVSDASLSASNLNSMVLEDRPLKENVSYKCKMMCFEDSGNS